MRLERKSIGTMVSRGLTPLLDTLFILLFALLALSDTRQVDPAEEVRIQLPEVEAGEGTPPAPGEVFTLLVDAESAVSLGSSDGRAEALGTLAELDAALAERLGTALPEEVAIDIVGDAEARHGVMVELLQHLRLLGFTRVQLLAAPAEDGATSLGRPRR